jgi:hypothetical protein
MLEKNGKAHLCGKIQDHKDAKPMCAISRFNIKTIKYVLFVLFKLNMSCFSCNSLKHKLVTWLVQEVNFHICLIKLGMRFKEGCNINRSLFILGQVIKKLSDGQIG